MKKYQDKQGIFFFQLLSKRLLKYLTVIIFITTKTI